MPNTKNYTNLAISQELEKLGFKLSQDYYSTGGWWSEGELYSHQYDSTNDRDRDGCQAFTAQDILDVLPYAIPGDFKNDAPYTLEMYRYTGDDEYEVCYQSYNNGCLFVCDGETLADALGKLLIELIKKGIVKV